MTVKGFADCACAELATSPMPEPGPAAVWLPANQGGIRRALMLLRQERGRYRGGVHVGGLHVAMVFDDDGTRLLPSNAGFFPADYDTARFAEGFGP